VRLKTPVTANTRRVTHGAHTVAERAVALARRSRFVHEMHTLAGPGATIDVQPFDRAGANRWRLVVSLDAPDGFTLAVRLNTDSHPHPRHVFLAADELRYAVFPPGSFHGAWSDDVGATAATLTRLRRERQRVARIAPPTWRRPDFCGAGQTVRDDRSGRVGEVAVVTPAEYAIAVKWDDTGELSYVTPTRLSPAVEAAQPGHTVR
jgi:hypothetical protein